MPVIGRLYQPEIIYDDEYGEVGGIKIDTCLSATLSTENPKWPDLGPNPHRRGEKPGTNRLSYGKDSTRN